MQEVALYDYTPVFRLMMMGLVIALGPLAWVWLRGRKGGTRARLARSRRMRRRAFSGRLAHAMKSESSICLPFIGRECPLAVP